VSFIKTLLTASPLFKPSERISGPSVRESAATVTVIELTLPTTKLPVVLAPLISADELAKVYGTLVPVGTLVVVKVNVTDWPSFTDADPALLDSE
jgi:xanthine/uracil/vitamin C permease (AzgA family)